MRMRTTGTSKRSPWATWQVRLPGVILLLGAGIGLAGCREPMGVCDYPHACEVPGYDLEVVDAMLADPIGTDAETGLLIAPSSFHVRFTVRNRGSEVSPEGSAGLDLGGATDDLESGFVPIPPLDPGSAVTLEDSLAVIPTFLPARADIWKARVVIQKHASGPDTDPSNDVLFADSMHLAVPLLDFRVQPIGVPRLFVNEPFVVRLTVANRSRHATLHGVVVVGCLWDEDQACHPRIWTWFGRHPLPDVTPGDSAYIAYTTAVPPTSAYQDEAFRVWYSVCALPDTWTDPYLPTGRSPYCRFPSDNFIRMRPDYEGACAPPTLIPDGTVVLPEINCGLMPPTSQTNNDWLRYYRFHLVALDTDAGATWVIERNPKNNLYGIFDIEGEEVPNLASGDSIRVARAGRYYLPYYSNADTFTVTLRRGS